MGSTNHSDLLPTSPQRCPDVVGTIAGPSCVHRVLDAFARQRQIAQPLAGGIGDGIGDRRRRGPPSLQNRIGLPVNTGDPGVVEGDAFVQRPAHRLHDFAFDLVGLAVRIDHLAAVDRSHRANQPRARSSCRARSRWRWHSKPRILVARSRWAIFRSGSHCGRRHFPVVAAVSARAQRMAAPCAVQPITLQRRPAAPNECCSKPRNASHALPERTSNFDAFRTGCPRRYS